MNIHIANLLYFLFLLLSEWERKTHGWNSLPTFWKLSQHRHQNLAVGLFWRLWQPSCSNAWGSHSDTGALKPCLKWNIIKSSILKMNDSQCFSVGKTVTGRKIQLLGFSQNLTVLGAHSNTDTGNSFIDTYTGWLTLVKNSTSVFKINKTLHQNRRKYRLSFVWTISSYFALKITSQLNPSL